MSPSGSDVDPRVLGQLLAAQSTLSVFSARQKMGEFMHRAVEGMPGVASCAVCLPGAARPGLGGEPIAECAECDVPAGDLDHDPGHPCRVASRAGMRVLPLRTQDRHFGFLLVTVAGPERYAPYEPFVGNLANGLAVNIERQWHRDRLEAVNGELRRHREHLEELVKERTAALELAVERERHLNAVLRAIRNVNQLITREKERDRLLQEACGILAETRGFRCVWIVALAPDGRVEAAAEAGLGAAFADVRAQCERGDLPECCRRALGSEAPIVVADPMASCGACPVAPQYRGTVGMAAALRHGGKAFGVLVAALPPEMTDDAVELSLFGEAAGDLAFALYDIELDRQRQRAEAALHESEQRYRSLFVHMVDGYAYCRMLLEEGAAPDFVYLDVNPAFETITGLKGIVGRRVSEVIPGIQASNPELFEIYGRVASSGAPERFESHVEALGVWFDISVYRPAPGEFVAVFADVTKRRLAEAAVAESARTLRTIFDSVTDGILLADAETTRLTAANQAMCRMLGYAEEELLALHVADLHPEADLPRVREQFEAQARGELKLALDLPLRRKDGSVFFTDVNAAPGILGDRPHLFGVFRDTTQRKQQEQLLRQTEAQLQQAQKMEAVGRLAGGVAHDFNNLLSIILSNCDFALETLVAGDPLREDIHDIKEAGERAANLTRQLLSFSRRQMLQPRILDLNEVIRDLNRMLPRLLGEDIAIVLALAPTLGLVRADPGQLEQVIVNLAVNARDAMPDGGKLLVETADVELDEDYVRRHVTGAVGSFVRLTVSDTGCGMDRETQARIFEPFFTTKEKGRGTGLGLSTVYGIVKQSNGFIWVYSEPGQGTTFKVYLPRLTSAEQPWRPANGAETLRGGDETILLVEDSAEVRAAAARALRNLGYRVLEADGLEAARRVVGSAASIHLLLTDVVMPGGSGREVGAAVRAAHPAARVLYMSGYTDNAILHHGVLDPGVALLQKPFTPDLLGRKVREVLDGGDPGPLT